MSFILDQIHRIDTQLDRLQLTSATAPFHAPISTSSSSSQQPPADPSLSSSTIKPSDTSSLAAKESLLGNGERILQLQASIRRLSGRAAGGGGATSRGLVKIRVIEGVVAGLSDKRFLASDGEKRDGRGGLLLGVDGVDEEARGEEDEGDGVRAGVVVEEGGEREKGNLERELEWLVVSKATVQVYGWVLRGILDETVRLAEEGDYWDAVLGSRVWTGVYGVQVSPVRFWRWGMEVWDEAKGRLGEEDLGVRRASDGVVERWRQFYGLVRGVVEERSVVEVRRQVLSPVTRLRGEIRAKKAALKKIRLRNANALGVLLGEGLANESSHGEGLIAPQAADLEHRWKASVARNVALMEAVLTKATDLDTPLAKFDASVGQLTEDDPLYVAEAFDGESELQPQAVAERLARVLKLALPQYTTSTKAIVREHGKPSRIVRYWLPVTVGVLSSSTILRILVNRQADVRQWIQDLGATMIDFWQNWVVEPTRKVIKTIRHDEGSEVSIMSKRSLEGDRDSLERMVVDFAIDNPSQATGSSSKLSEAEIADVRAKVREGDLTPVLRAYEKDLASPFMGTLRGNLIRALLIQIQKTKVDVEIAIGGIDSLLKSQELVFGFVGLTPGILVTYFALRSLRSSFTERRGGAAIRKQGKMIRQLRNIDRILANSTPTEEGELYYQDQGLLLCEVHVLRQAAEKAMPTEIFKEFGEDAEELCDVRMGVERQKKAADRVRWAYAKWMA